jgi:hypothetical protein
MEREKMTRFQLFSPSGGLLLLLMLLLLLLSHVSPTLDPNRRPNGDLTRTDDLSCRVMSLSELMVLELLSVCRVARSSHPGGVPADRSYAVLITPRC